jgi:phytoene dehydrogenase-like protein
MLPDPLLVEMILCPLMYYGSSYEQDMDLCQFAIMFRAIFLEGMFRPEGTMKDFIDLLESHFQSLGGSLRLSCGVKKILLQQSTAIGVELECGETIECDHLVSTIGHAETLRLISGFAAPQPELPRLGFVESIFQIQEPPPSPLPANRTIIFFNNGNRFRYKSPDNLVDFSSGVICFPANFQDLPPKSRREVRSTHLANYAGWKLLSASPDDYTAQKQGVSRQSVCLLENIIGSFSTNIVYEDTFTPVTIERYTSKIGGAIYGSPIKIKDGDIGFSNLFLAGTDQGFLGIIGSMLSGVSIVNRHVLPKL